MRVRALMGCWVALWSGSVVGREAACPEGVQSWIALQGFHRELHVLFALPFARCPPVVVQRIPGGAMVDSDQIRHLESLNGKPIAGPVPIVDVERPASASLGFDLLLYPIASHNSSQYCVYWKAVLPVHFRYHAPQALGDAKVSWSPPVVCSSCVVGTCTNESERICAELDKGKSVSSESAHRCLVQGLVAIDINVPVGNVHDFGLVMALTALSVLGGTVAIVFAS